MAKFQATTSGATPKPESGEPTAKKAARSAQFKGRVRDKIAARRAARDVDGTAPADPEAVAATKAAAEDRAKAKAKKEKKQRQRAKASELSTETEGKETKAKRSAERSAKRTAKEQAGLAAPDTTNVKPPKAKKAKKVSKVRVIWRVCLCDHPLTDGI
jgi:hypothetical protein